MQTWFEPPTIASPAVAALLPAEWCAPVVGRREPDPTEADGLVDPALAEAVGDLHRWTGAAWVLYDGETGRLLWSDPAASPEAERLSAGQVHAALQHRKPQALPRGAGVALCLLPLERFRERPWLAAALARLPAETHEAAAAASLAAWDGGLGLRPPESGLAALERALRTAFELWSSRRQTSRLQRELDGVSENLAHTYEEISLLYRLTQNLRLSHGDEDLAGLAIQWLQDCVPAECVAAVFLPVTAEGEATYQARTRPRVYLGGEPLLDAESFPRLIAALELSPGCGPLVDNGEITGRAEWPFPGIRQLIVAPLAEGENLFGWLAAINRRDDREFGTVEASLLNSVGAILGIHSGNRELYRQQAEFLASVVRALTSAIDAKDPYTCGHSDRVARVAVRLGQELHCDDKTLHTLYMSGLLHDIGKIGVDDQVLRKPGRLTDEELRHIQQHPDLGYKILADLKQLADVLPVVLHHHEQWDGGGYPARLRADQIPKLARIAAVADAYDAMTSDRPYRRGMPVERVEEIFRQGAGKQWDAAVVSAYFRCREDIRAIVARERAELSLDVQRWASPEHPADGKDALADTIAWNSAYAATH